MRGTPELYETVKERIYIRLSDQSSNGITSLSEQLKLSRSELLEQIGRKIIVVRITTQAIGQGDQLEKDIHKPRCFALTVPGIQGLDELSGQAGITRKAFIAQLGLRRIQIISNLGQIQ